MPSKTFDVRAFENWSNRTLTQRSEVAKSIVENAISEGEFLMKETIMTKGTNKIWASSWPSRAFGRKDRSTEARFDTGEMRDSVESRLVTVTKARVVGEFGWLNNQQDYFIYQDQGFTHRNGQVIPAMNALRDAFTYVTTNVKNELGKAFGK